MQAGGRGNARPPVGVAFEGDLGHRLDALLVPAILNGFVAKGEARAIALCISRPSLRTAQLADVVSRFYGGGGRGPGGAAMVGMPEGPLPSNDTPPLAAILSKPAADGKAQPYSSSIRSLIDTADNAVVIRNILLAQNDGNAVIVLAGPATGLARMMDLLGAIPQITAKVRLLVVAAGAFPTGAADPGIAADVAAAKTLFAGWPTPIVAVGSEVGTALPYPGATLAQDFEWAPNHPIADAYKLAKPMPHDAPASALAAALHAVHPDAGHFKLSEPGTITVRDDGRTDFAPAANGRHRYLIADPTKKDAVTKLYAELVTAEPARRPQRGGPPPAQQQQQQQKPAPPAQQKPAPPQNPPAAKPPAP
jgi:hypothetical protein